jgi:hypothetical protein
VKSYIQEADAYFVMLVTVVVNGLSIIGAWELVSGVAHLVNRSRFNASHSGYNGIFGGEEKLGGFLLWALALFIVMLAGDIVTALRVWDAKTDKKEGPN